MSEGIQTIVFGSTHRLTAKSTVSLEMPLIAEQVQSKDGVSTVAKLEADFIRVEAMLVEMREIRESLERSLISFS